MQAFANVDASWTYLHTQLAVDAIAKPSLFRVDRTFATTTRLAAFLVVGNDKRVFVEHRALETCIRAHVLAYLLAHVTRVTVGCESVEEHPEQRPPADVECEDVDPELTNRYKEADKGKAGPQGKREPQQLLGALAPQLVQ